MGQYRIRSAAEGAVARGRLRIPGAAGSVCPEPGHATNGGRQQKKNHNRLSLNHLGRNLNLRAAAPLASVPPSGTILAPLAPPPILVHLALLTVSLLFGANYVVTKRILADVPPAAWVLCRIVGATLVIVPLALWLRRRHARPPARILWGLALASLLGIVANQVLFTEGMARTTPQHSAVINALIPTWTLLAAVLFRQERLTVARLLAIVVALAGVQYLLGVDRLLFGGGGAPADGATLLGDLLTMANGMSFALHLVLMRRIGRQVDPWFATATMFVFATTMMSAWSLPQTSSVDVQPLLAAPTLWFGLYAVLFSTVLTYLLNTWALRHTHSSQVALYINVQPLVAAALDVAFGAPAPGPRFFVALGLVGLGLWLQSRKPG
jgi:drug/metabolite transporter (DMT)-like permease